MKLSEQALENIRKSKNATRLNDINSASIDRKRQVYWVGFLDGILSSKRIEGGEVDALLAEAKSFVAFFDDPDASDLIEDLTSSCFSDEADLVESLQIFIDSKRQELIVAGSYKPVDELNEFLGFCAGIVCDGSVLENEAKAILERFRSSEILMTSAPFSQLRRGIEVALADGVLSEQEAEEVREWIAQLVGDGFIDTGLSNIGHTAALDEPISDPAMIELAGRSFVLTGPMSLGTRGFISSEIERCGGEVHSKPKRATDYVVVSNQASRHWRTTHFGTKIERTFELIREGHPVRFVTERALGSAIGKHTP